MGLKCSLRYKTFAGKSFLLCALLIVHCSLLLAQHVGVNSIKSPKSGYYLSDNEPVTIIVTNYGSSTIHNIPVSCVLTTNNEQLITVFTDTIRDSIVSNQNYYYTFRERVDLTCKDTLNCSFSLKAFTSLSGDQNHSNDTAYSQIINLKHNYCKSGSLYPKFDNIGMVKLFTGNGLLVTENGKATPVYNNDSCIHSYVDFSKALSPINLIPDSTYTISVSQIEASAIFNDCWVNVFIDYNNDGVFDYYTERPFGKMTMVNQTTVSGKFKVPHDAKSGITGMRIIMQEGGDATSALPCVDYNWGETQDYPVRIAPSIAQDAGVIDIIKPSSREGEDVILPVKVVVHNFGYAQITSMDISYSLPSTINYKISTIHWTGNLNPYRNDTVTLPALKIPPYTNAICAYTTLLNDSNSYNDQFCKSFYGNPKIDVGATALLSPRQNDCYNSTESISVRVKSYGSQPIDLSKNNLITTVNIALTTNNEQRTTNLMDTLGSGILSVGDSIDIVFPQTYDMSAGGKYVFNAFTTMSGDKVSANNNMPQHVFNVFLTINIGELSNQKYDEIFESFTPGTYTDFPDGWASGSPNSQLPTPDSYHWQANQGPLSLAGTGPLVDHTLGTKKGTYVYVNADSAGAPVYLISPCLDISVLDHPFLSFWYHMAGKDINNLNVDIYTGSVWKTDVFNLTGFQQNDVTSPWKQAFVDLAPYKGTIKIRFVAVRGNGPLGDIAIDDISVFESALNDAGIKSFITSDLLPPVSGIKAGTNQPISLVIRNYGDNPITSLSVAYKLDNLPPVIESWSGFLNPDHDTLYTFTKPLLVTQGQHNLCASVNIANDNNATNDTACVSFSGVLTKSPFIETFETFPVCNQSDNQINCQSDVLTNRWTRQEFDTYKWFANNGTVISSDTQLPVSNTGPAVDHTSGTFDGKYMVVDAGNGNFNDVTALISPSIDLSVFSHPKLSFWYHFYGTDIDSITVDIFANSQWTYLKTIKGQKQTKQRKAWKEAIIDISAYSGIIKIKFNAVRGKGIKGDMAIDDVSINNFLPVDIGVLAIRQPDIKAINAGSVQNAVVNIQNTGLTGINNFYVGYIIGNNTPVLEKCNAMLLPDSSVDYTFKAGFTVPSGKFYIKSFTECLNDSNRVNDTLTSKYIGIATFKIPYSDTFDNNNYWYTYDTIPHWQFGIPAKSFIRTTNNEQQTTNLWATELNGTYRAGAEYDLYSPKFNFSNVSGAVLSFMHYINCTGYDDGGMIMYSTDANPDWATLGYINDPLGTNWYNDYINGSTYWIYTNYDAWINSTYDLSAMNNLQSPVRFRFSFISSPNSSFLIPNSYGWALADFAINLHAVKVDAGIVSIINPTSYTPTGSNVQVKVRIKNFGTDTLSTIPLSYQVDNNTPVLDTFSILNSQFSILPDSSAEFTFRKTFTSKYAYNLCASTNVKGDANASNDKSCFHSFDDIGAYWIEEPISEAFIDTSTAVTVSIKNYGVAVIDTADITFTVNGVPKAKEKWSGRLFPGSIANYTFSTKLQPISGTFRLCAYASMLNDANPANNQVCKSINSIDEVKPILHSQFSILNSYPNPASDNINIEYFIPESSGITIEIYNIYGLRLYSSTAASLQGKNTITLDLNSLSSGIYFCRLSCKNLPLTHTILKL